MSLLGQRIEKEFQQLPFQEQLDLLPRLVERIKKMTTQVPRRASFSSDVELAEKAIEGLNSPSSPMTESDWNALDSRITRIAESNV